MISWRSLFAAFIAIKQKSLSVLMITVGVPFVLNQTVSGNTSSHPFTLLGVGDIKCSISHKKLRSISDYPLELQKLM
jgi:hypothetical protein